MHEHAAAAETNTPEYYHHLADVYFLRDAKNADGSYPAWALRELVQQRATSVGEGSVPYAVIPVEQTWDSDREAYIGYGDSTIRHAFTGINDLDLQDPRNEEELGRRGAEYLEEIRLTRDEPLRDELASGKYKIALSCRPETGHPLTEYMRQTFDYDERTMVRGQTLSRDKRTKRSVSIALFDIPNRYFVALAQKQWGAGLSEGSTAMLQQSVEQDLLVEADNPFELIDWLYRGLQEVIDDETVLDRLNEQYARTVNGQKEYHEIVTEKAREGAEFVMQVERSLSDGYATPDVLAYLQSVMSNMSAAGQLLIGGSWRGPGMLSFGEDLALLVMKAKKNNLETRAGVLAGNEEITAQVVAQGGSSSIAAILHAETMARITGNVSVADRWVSTMNIKTGGGCSGRTKDIFNTADTPDGAQQENSGAENGDASRSAEASDWSGGKIHYNEKCACCKVVKAEVGACYICRECVANPKKRQAVYDAEMRSRSSETKPGREKVAGAVGGLFGGGNGLLEGITFWPIGIGRAEAAAESAA